MENRITPIGVSNRHVHLKEDSIQTLFGKKSLDIMKELSQPGQFAAEQIVDLLGPMRIPGDDASRKIIEKVRVLGPARSADQVELSITDARSLGIKNIPIRLSGKYIGAYYTLMGGCDAIVFTAGVMENSPYMRSLVAEKLECLGIQYDKDINNCRGKKICISTKSSKTPLRVIPTNEEGLIVREVKNLLS